MASKHTIQEAMKSAMRARDKQRLGAIRLILAELKRIEVDTRQEITGSEIIAVLAKMVKQRQDSIAHYEKAARQELAEQEKLEIAVINEFLPPPLSGDELNNLLQQAIATTQASSPRDIGKVMAAIAPKVKGRADMRHITDILKKKLI